MAKKKKPGASEAKKKRMEAKRLVKMARRAEKKAAQAGSARPQSLQGLVGISQPLQQKKQYPTGDSKAIPPAPLLELIHDFLKDYKYIKAAHGVRTDNQKRPGHNMAVWKHSSKGYPDLIKIFRTWVDQNPSKVPDTKSEDASTAASDSSSSPSSSDDDAMPVDATTNPSAIVTAPNATLANLKRKASTSSSDSDNSSGSGSDASSDSESDSEEELESGPAAKKAKVEHTTAKLPTTSGSISSSSNSSSEDESDSSVPSPAPNTVPAQSMSSSDSSSEESEEEEPSTEIKKSISATRNSSDSSATIQGVDSDLHQKAGRVSSPSSDSSSSDSSVLPDQKESAPPKQKEKKKQELIVYNEPLSKKKRKRDPDAVGEQKIVPATANTFKKLKKAHISFSRIPDDVKVDERFASNKYVPYDYAEKAHNDLIVTKGKGFTKAKNKGKRGSYRGGMIDTNSARGIKFDD